MGLGFNVFGISLVLTYSYMGRNEYHNNNNAIMQFTRRLNLSVVLIWSCLSKFSQNKILSFSFVGVKLTIAMIIIIIIIIIIQK